MSWNEIGTQADADALLKVFGGFHDGCLKEAHLYTNCWGDHDLAMAPGLGLDNCVRILVQRQWKDPAAIELLFEEVTRFNLVPSPEDCDSIIFNATLIVRDSLVYWSVNGSWSPDDPQKDLSTWISARKLRWREVGWLGEDLLRAERRRRVSVKSCAARILRARLRNSGGRV